MAAHRFVAVVGSRKLPQAWALQVAEVVRFFLARGWGIGSGGARGADQFALEAVVAAGAGGRAFNFLRSEPTATKGRRGASWPRDVRHRSTMQVDPAEAETEDQDQAEARQEHRRPEANVEGRRADGAHLGDAGTQAHGREGE